MYKKVHDMSRMKFKYLFRLPANKTLKSFKSDVLFFDSMIDITGFSSK